MADNARCAGIPRVGLVWFSWLFFRSYIWPHSFQERATVSGTGKAGCGDSQNTDKTQMEQMDPSERLEFVQRYLARTSQPRSVAGSLPQYGFATWSAWMEIPTQLWRWNSGVFFVRDIFILLMKAGVKVYPETLSAALKLIKEQDCQVTSLPP